MKKQLILSSVFILTFFAFFIPKKISASTLTNLKDQISTSRPSASSPINANQAANATDVTVYDNNSIFLASDSAILKNDTGETLGTTNIASTAAVVTGTRKVYFASSVASTHHNGDPLIVSIPAIHTISFISPNGVPATGKIVISFPSLTTGDSNNAASPSATTFQLNGLGDTDVKITAGLSGATTFDATMTNPSAGTSPTISIALTGTTTIAAGATVTIVLGCTGANDVTCTTNKPLIINPTQNSIVAGTARIWQFQVDTTDSADGLIDSGHARIATVDSVLVQATVDPSLTVTVAGLAGNANYNSSAGSCVSETATCGITSTATNVNLGVLGSANINHCGQTITVTTNAADGYVITATSSGRFIDPSTGSWIKDANGGEGLTANDTPAAATLPTSGNPAFGISPCGARVSEALWNPDAVLAFNSGPKLSNPWNSGANAYYATVASYTAGPIAGDVTVIRYAATISTTTPAGLYRNIFTYVVTPTF